MMAQQPPLIAAKLNVPAPRRNYIPRSDLQERLGLLASHKVTVIKGAPGSGKSTALAAYLHEHPALRARWVSLDAGDNSMRTLWSYVLEALKPELGDEADALRELLGTTLQAGDVTTVLVELVNGLQPEDDVFLILDDAHYLTDGQVLESLQFFLRYAADRVHLVLLTRDEPTLYLGELRMAGQLLEIDNNDLKVTPAEARAFLTQTLGLQLREDVLQRIIDVAEGWIGGLQLLGVALMQKGEQLGSIASMGRPVVEYLSGDILTSLPAEEQHFLKVTSVVTYLDEDVCRAVTENDAAGELLQRLIEKHLFIIAVDEDKGLYRYHHLFQEFLLQQFATLPRDDRKHVHVRAAKFYRQANNMEQCVSHFLQAEQDDKALHVIEQMQSGINSWRLLQRVPLPALAGKLDLIYQRIFSHLAEQQFEQCFEIVDTFRGTFDDPLSNRLFDLFPTLIDHRPVQVEPEQWSAQTLRRLPLSNETKVILYSLLAMVLLFQEKEQDVLTCLAETDRIMADVENPYIRYYALQFKGQIKEHMGDLRECEAIFGDMFRLTEQHPFLMPTLVTAHISMTGVLLKAGRLDEARSVLDKVHHHALRSPPVEIAYLYNELEYHILNGTREEAAAAARRLVSLDVLDSSLYCSPMLRYLLLLDMADETTLARFQFDNIAVPHWEDYVLQAQLLLRAGRMSEAHDLLNERLAGLRKRQAKLPLVDTLLGKVQVLAAATEEQIKDRKGLARNVLREAVHYSYENHLLAPFMFVGRTIADTVRELRDDQDAELYPAEVAFLDVLLAQWGGGAPQVSHSQVTVGLLSERETEVLHVLAQGATNKQIAQQLYISVATVKTHIVNIYSKLGVSNRVEAVETARRHGMIVE